MVGMVALVLLKEYLSVLSGTGPEATAQEAVKFKVAA